MRIEPATERATADAHLVHVADGAVDAQEDRADGAAVGQTIGEPLFDLASVCVYHRYGKVERERLLAAYGESRGKISSQRLELACWLFDYIRELWMAVR